MSAYAKKLFRSSGFYAVICFLLLAFQPAFAFDTFWHSADTSAAGKQLGFTDDAINIMQFGNFSGPDFFGPYYDIILGKRMEENIEPSLKPRVEALAENFAGFRAGSSLQVRKMAIFMHFDNINGKLDGNWKFDYLFNRLLKNTQYTIATFYNTASIPPLHKKILVLMTLGASLHMIQDFYSHSDWTHHDFQKLGFSLVRMPWGKDRDPTWFEVKAKLGTPEKWPFKVSSGIYPDPKGAAPLSSLGTPMTHDVMNHDNSELFEDGMPWAGYHNFGPFPADAKNEASIHEHQLFAANTAAGASIEWIQKVMEYPAARQAIESCRGTRFGQREPALDFLTQALGSSLFLSCVAGRWDGQKPTPRHKTQCHGAFLSAGTGIVPTPYNLFWGMHVKYNIVEHLTTGFGSRSGDYVFDYNWWRNQK